MAGNDHDENAENKAFDQGNVNVTKLGVARMVW